MEQVRESIKNGNFKELKKRVVKAYEKAEKGVNCPELKQWALRKTEHG
jgi:queuine/archaeosine tRNA-ribosyltransferase